MAADLHLFQAGGQTCCLDVNSTTVFAIDDSVSRALERADGGTATREERAVIDAYRREGFFAGNTKARRLAEQASRAEMDLLGISLLVSGACNLSCSYCFNGGGADATGDDPPMTRDTAFRAVDFLLANSSGQIGLDYFGGEPLLSLDLVREIVAYAEATDRDVVHSMITNGTLVDEEVASYLAEKRFHVVVSYDGGRQDDERRSRDGSPQRARLQNAIRLLVSTMPATDLSIRCTYTNRNTSPDDVIREATDLGVRVLFGPVTVPESDAHAPSTAKLTDLVSAQRSWLMEAIRTGDLDTLHRVGCAGNTMLRLLSGQPRFYSCGIGKDILAVSARGDLYPCHRFLGIPQFRLGTIETGVDPATYRRYAAHHVDNRDECAACWARYLCGGGCAHDAWIIGGDVFGAAHSRCEFTRQEIELGLQLYVLAMEEQPELLTNLADRVGLQSVRPLDGLRAAKESP